MTSVPLSLQRENEATTQDDLSLRLGNHVTRCDSSLLATSDSPHTARGVREGLADLLGQWLAQLEPLRARSGTVFLPFALYDQCSGWLRVTSFDSRTAVVEVGWSGIEGWSFQPSDFASTARAMTDFEPSLGTALRCGLGELIATVRQNHEDVRLGFRRPRGDPAPER
ncbi:hypothetical protein [Streptomyces sp. NPDC005438]|uniref:hypothetical protein n=1 Tax=Streptomyces sp. NPDC005438 TaxID=3156880 RepID=UPI0033BD6A4E